MNIEMSQTILFSIAGVAFVVWLFGVQYLRATLVQDQLSEDSGLRDLHLQEVNSRDWTFGNVEVEGQPAALAEKAAQVLARDSLTLFGPVKILGRTDKEVGFEVIGASGAANSHGYSRTIKRGWFRFDSQGGNSTRITFAAELAPLQKYLTIALILQLLGLIVLAGGAILMYFYEATSGNPGVRAQSFQMVQFGHLLWPPLFFTSLYRRIKKVILARMEAFAGNLPFQSPS